ncbi:MAG TPA: alcohol dehydrogenase catalytic domain-containing protein, partial [Candidatus Polarisedimenticolia bacterium]|nr:alcohol dehydrogenase catalytic domain-containing protein [Candidatus Polarisedimenticolia bacterium]
MLALWLEKGALRLRDDLPEPDPPPGEALVRVRLAGICSTDLELLAGYYPFRGVPGHEFVGEVARGPRHLRGRRVVGEINAVCGSCPACMA